ncbi:MAG: hypothetical protein ACTSWY_15885 [Promethearchaeota archaeon]
MSIRFYNPPLALLSKGTKEGVDIGGSLSIIAMDREYNLHTVSTIFSELSWGQFWKEEEISDQIETITVTHDDTAVLFDPEELLIRLVNAFIKIRENKWIFFGIADMECNSFMDAMCLDLDYSYVERLLGYYKRISDKERFPKLLNEGINNEGYISIKFNGNKSEMFHRRDETLYSIFNEIKPISGNVTGIVCSSQGAANLYILNENLHILVDSREYRIDTGTLENAFSLMKKNVIFPISWFRFDLGISSLKTLGQWDDIKRSKKLIKELQDYFKYSKTVLRKEHEQTLKKKNRAKSKNIDFTDMSDEEREDNLNNLKEILSMGDLGLFKDIKGKD